MRQEITKRLNVGLVKVPGIASVVVGLVKILIMNGELKQIQIVEDVTELECVWDVKALVILGIQHYKYFIMV
jgi:hypothetical protein